MLSVIRLFLESVSEDNRRTPGPALPCDGLARRRDLSLLLDPPQMIGVSSLMIRAVSAGVRYGDACPAHVGASLDSGRERLPKGERPRRGGWGDLHDGSVRGALANRRRQSAVVGSRTCGWMLVR